MPFGTRNEARIYQRSYRAFRVPLVRSAAAADLGTILSKHCRAPVFRIGPDFISADILDMRPVPLIGLQPREVGPRL